jgi:hypothetical protein
VSVFCYQGNVMHASIPPIANGERVYFVGHSFHMFIVRPLIRLAKEAGIKGHWAQGWDMIGGSTPTQHWERGGEDNAVKKALATGQVQVLTLATNVRVVDPAVDWFADLAIQHNPDVRVLLQHSWGDNLTNSLMRNRHDAREAGAAQPSAEELAAAYRAAGDNTERDRVTGEELAKWRSAGRGIDRWRNQITAINQRHARTLGYIVPVNDAVLRTRQAIVEGTLPGVKLQSELFRDVLGHATQPTMDLVSYAWFACLYRRSPIGLTSLIPAGDATARAQHERLQKIAWAAVLDEPLSGVARA